NLRTQPEKVREAIDKAVAKSHLRHSLMKQARSIYELENDPDLKELKEVAQADPLWSGRPLRDVVTLTFKPGTYQPMQLPGGRRSLGRAPAREPGPSWGTEDWPRRGRPFEQARVDVERAWRTEQARALARKKAEQIQEEVKANVARNGSAAEAAAVLRGHGA